jgi:hypothetical protein
MACWHLAGNMPLLMELDHSLRRGSTKMPRLTALPVHTGERSGAPTQRRRRDISVEPGNPFFKAPAGRHIWSISLTCCESVFYDVCKRHSPYRAEGI